MESYRVYKSLPLNDFMDDVQFIVAKCGLLITPIIQDINYLKHNDLHSEHYWKQYFMIKVQNMLAKEKDNINCDIDVTDMGSFGYWVFVPRWKEKHTISDICEECKQCENYMVCENGCFGSTKPCEQLQVTENNNPNNEQNPIAGKNN